MNNSIMCYRVSEPRMAVLREACEDLGLGILETDLATDVIAIGSLMVVVDPEAIGPRDLLHCLSMVAALGDPEVRLVATSAAWCLPSEFVKYLTVPETWSRECLGRLLGGVRRRALNRQVYDRLYGEPLRRIMFIRRQLAQEHRISTAEVTARFKVSNRTVQRDIEVLNAAGRRVFYDFTSGVYRG